MQIPPTSSVTASVATGLGRTAQNATDTHAAVRTDSTKQAKPTEADQEIVIELDIAGSIPADREADRPPQQFSGTEQETDSNTDHPKDFS